MRSANRSAGERRSPSPLPSPACGGGPGWGSWGRGAALGWGAAFCAAIVLGGCAVRSATDSPTGGVSLRMAVVDEPNSRALYRVEADGSLSFGGGLDAVRRKTSWTGQMTEAEIDELLALLERDGWFRGEPADRDGPNGRVYEVTVCGPEGRQRYKLRGESAAAGELNDLLDRIARRRFDSFLERFPRAEEGK